MPVLVNLLGFVWCWLALVLGAFHDLVGPAMALFGCWAALHLFYSRTRASDLRLLVAACLCGPLVDAALLAGDWIEYAAHAPGNPLAPLWIYGMWANFALILNYSMAWMRGRPLLLVALLGAIAGPLSYLAGIQLGAVDLAQPLWVPLLIIALGWAIVWPVLENFTVARPVSGPVGGRTTG